MKDNAIIINKFNNITLYGIFSWETGKLKKISLEGHICAVWQIPGTSKTRFFVETPEKLTQVENFRKIGENYAICNFHHKFFANFRKFSGVGRSDSGPILGLPPTVFSEPKSSLRR